MRPPENEDARLHSVEYFEGARVKAIAHGVKSGVIYLFGAGCGRQEACRGG